MNLKDLTKEIPYKWREGPGGKRLAYIDARDVMNLLDDVVGPTDWQDQYELVGDKIIAGIGIRTDDGQWVWKYDTGTESNIEEEKGMFSDAFKRAAVKWGVGRFLYDIDPTASTTQKFNPKAIKTTPKDFDLDDDLTIDFGDTKKILRDTKGHTTCTACGKAVSKKVEEFSIDKFGRILCMDCQKKVNEDNDGLPERRYM